MHSVVRRLASAGPSRAVRLASPQWTQAPKARSRQIHTRRPLPYDVEDGMGKFLTPEGLKMIAVEYQQGLLDRLNEQTKGTELKNVRISQIVISAAGDASRSLAFNYASEALNNDYFLQRLKPPPAGKADHEDQISPALSQALKTQMSDVQQLKSSFSSAALGMASSGWVWFVSDSYGNIGIIPTYGAGTLLVAGRRQLTAPGVDYGAASDLLSSANPSVPLSGTTPSSPASGLSHAPSPLSPSSPSRSLHTSASVRADFARPARPNSVYSGTQRSAGRDEINASGTNAHALDKLGDVLFPLFCVSVHEHAWIGSGYGVWGKEEYLKRFWSCLDWEAVSKDFQRFAVKRAIPGR
ncbi:Manganese/iron superoxide dismutase [Amylostereum chailletii]|nr:Manganese/iron superoxide dismutase [Amylostereum chailletii]